MAERILTRGGVCKDLSKSPYNFTVVHKGDTVTFNFSSKLHLDNFTKKRHKNYSMIYNDIYKRYKFSFDCTLLSDFNLYKKIESRGMYINYNGNILQSYNNIKLR